MGECLGTALYVAVAATADTTAAGQPFVSGATLIGLLYMVQEATKDGVGHFNPAVTWVCADWGDLCDPFPSCDCCAVCGWHSGWAPCLHDCAPLLRSLPQGPPGYLQDDCSSCHRPLHPGSHHCCLQDHRLCLQPCLRPWCLRHCRHDAWCLCLQGPLCRRGLLLLHLRGWGQGLCRLGRWLRLRLCRLFLLNKRAA